MINTYINKKMIVLLSFFLFTYNISAIVILPEVRVKNEIVTLRDIVWTLEEDLLYKLENIELGRIRVPGGRIIVRRDTLASKFISKNISPNKINIPERVIIERAFRSIKKEDLEEIIKIELDKIYIESDYDYKIDIASAEVIRMPIGELTYSLSNNAYDRNLGRRSLELLIYEEEKEVYKIPFGLDVGKFIKEYTLKRDVRAGDTFSLDLVDLATNFVYEERQLNYLEYKEGQVFRKNLLAGTKLSSSHLEKKTLINKDEKVEVYLRFGNMQIRDKALALDSGDVGEEIRLRNLRTDKIIRGIIKDDKSVEIISN